MNKNYYKILQVDPSAEQAIIKSAFRTLMLELKKHPDCGGEHENAQLINEAYEVLKNPISRKEYDKQNYFEIRNSGERSNSAYYMRCYFCGTINRIYFNADQNQLKSISCGKCHSPFFSQSMDIHEIQKEKRRHTRFKCQFNIQFQIDYGGMWYNGECIDLSSNGMRFISPIHLRMDQIIKIKFKNDRKFQAIAKTVRCIKKATNSQMYYESAITYIEARYEAPSNTQS